MNKQVICEIDGQYFGLDSLLVRSIENGKAEMLLEETPDFCEGIIKFRGEWVPLIRLRTLLNIDKSEEPRLSQIIYFKTSFGTLGFRVDKVVEIDNIDDKDLQTIPIVANSGKTAYVGGACCHHGRIIVIFNHEKLINQDDLSRISKGLKAVYEAEEAERRRKEEEEARRKAEEEEAKRKAEEEEAEHKAEEEETKHKAEEEETEHKAEEEETKRKAEEEEAKRKAEEEAAKCKAAEGKTKKDQEKEEAGQQLTEDSAADTKSAGKSENVGVGPEEPKTGEKKKKAKSEVKKSGKSEKKKK